VLATVYGFVMQSGGFIWVDSRPGDGTAFEIYLPAIAAPLDASRVTLPEMTARGGNETILLAEDDDAVRRLVSDVLQKKGYSVLEAHDGDEALAVAQNHAADIHLLLTDVVMPGLHGTYLAQRLTAIRPNVRVLYTTGYSDVTRLAGVEDAFPLLMKPFASNELLQRIRDILDDRRVATDRG
jgi:two-component system cell cycle sensor histidine kinase/response regulator CckA